MKKFLFLPFILALICSFMMASADSRTGSSEPVQSGKNKPDSANVIASVTFDDGSALYEFRYHSEAEFPGGLDSMYVWIEREMRYPEEAIRDKAQGRVSTEFQISKRGEIKNARVIRGRHPALDAEALRIIRNMPKWTPAYMYSDSTPVAVHYILPISFKLPSEPAE